MGVRALPDDIDGMLFVFDGAAQVWFTMRDTLIDLDIWWFDASGRLIGSTPMVPCRQTPCRSYPSPGPVTWALETPAGSVGLLPNAVLVAPAGT